MPIQRGASQTIPHWHLLLLVNENLLGLLQEMSASFVQPQLHLGLHLRQRFLHRLDHTLFHLRESSLLRRINVTL